MPLIHYSTPQGLRAADRAKELLVHYIGPCDRDEIESIVDLIIAAVLAEIHPQFGAAFNKISELEDGQPLPRPRDTLTR